MRWFEKLIEFFTIKDSQEYVEVIDRINQLKKTITDVNMTVPGSKEPCQIVLTDTKWTSIKETLGRNMKMIGLEFCDDYKITYNEMNDGYLFYHKHTKNYEFLYLIDGEMDVLVNGERIKLDEDNRSLLINIGDYHSIRSKYAKFVTYYSHEKEILFNADSYVKAIDLLG